MIVLSFLFMSVFSAVKALVNMSSGTNVLSRSKGLPGMGRTLVTSTVTASTNTILNASAAAAFMRDSTNIKTNTEANLTSVIAKLLFLLTVFFTPVFATVPNFTATPTLVFIKFLVMSTVMGISFRSLASTIPTCLYLVTVPLVCDVTRNVTVNMVSFMLVGLVYNGHGGVAPLVCVLTMLFVYGCVFLWLHDMQTTFR